MKKGTRTNVRYSETIKREVLSEISSGASIYSCEKKYSITRQTIKHWMLIFGEMKPSNKSPQSPVFSSAEEEIAYLRQQLKDSEKSCHYATMKAKALDMMIDVAEEKLSISIRKKSGTKQS